MIEKLKYVCYPNSRPNPEVVLAKKINEIIDILNSISGMVKAGLPLNSSTWMPGPPVIDEEDIDPIFLEVHTPPQNHNEINKKEVKMKIYKYELPLSDYTAIDMPKDAKILSAQSQSGKVFVWGVSGS